MIGTRSTQFHLPLLKQVIDMGRRRGRRGRQKPAASERAQSKVKKEVIVDHRSMNIVRGGIGKVDICGYELVDDWKIKLEVKVSALLNVGNLAKFVS